MLRHHTPTFIIEPKYRDTDKKIFINKSKLDGGGVVLYNASVIEVKFELIEQTNLIKVRGVL